MIIYHGSTVAVDEPRIIRGENMLDFGVGFYTTGSYEQAERWARIKMRRGRESVGRVSCYEFDIDEAMRELNVKRFAAADGEWLDFVIKNRGGAKLSGEYDIHIGPVADDSIYATIRLFETNILNADETIKRLKTEVLKDQYTFHTERALRFCHFAELREIR